MKKIIKFIKHCNKYGYLPEIKMLIADQFDKNEDYCWSALVMWAMGYYPFWSLFFKNHKENDFKSLGCKANKPGTPYAWCMKCESTKRFYKDY